MHIKKREVIYVIIIVSLIAITANQIYWIVNMYHAYKKEIVLDINRLIEKSVYMEITERGEKGGGFSAFPLYTANGDTARFIKKTIRGEGVSFEVEIDRQDPNANLKIAQYALKNMAPLDISRLNELFFQEMQQSKFPIQDTYVEYYDLSCNTLVGSSGERLRFTPYLSSDMIVIDIMNSMGVKAYVYNPLLSILGRMIVQLILSVVLIMIAVTGLFYLGRTVFRQWKEEKMRQESVNTMTHEFRRPISAAVGLVSLIPYYIGKNKLDKALRYVELTVDELNKLTAYTRRIQQISNNDKTTVILDKSEIEIRPFIGLLVEKFVAPKENGNAIQDNKPAKISLDIHPQQPVIYADRIHFANVLDNLIENAIKYSGEESVIRIMIDEQDKYLRISVKDNGFGISASDQKHIFDKYFRAGHRDIRQKAGFGLGLTYVKSIVEAHNGQVKMNSPGIGQGSEFIVYMPVVGYDLKG